MALRTSARAGRSLASRCLPSGAWSLPQQCGALLGRRGYSPVQPDLHADSLQSGGPGPWISLGRKARVNATASEHGSGGVLARYGALASKGIVDADPAQLALASELDGLRTNLTSYWSKPSGAVEAPEGLYIYGGVGTGKSLLAELFAASLPHDMRARYHFHDATALLHRRLFLLRQQQGRHDPVDAAARSFLTSTGVHRLGTPHPPAHPSPGFVVILDEFQLTDPADALLVLRVLAAWRAHKAVIVVTSNRHPSELYEGGLNRRQVLKGIDDMRWKIFRMDGKDWREHAAETRSAAPAAGTGPALRGIYPTLDSLVRSLPAGSHLTGPATIPIEIHGRTFPLPNLISGPIAGAVLPWRDAILGFRGASDYRALCAHLRGMSEGHPPFIAVTEAPYPITVPDTPSGLDPVRRFVVLLDVAYEAGVRVVLVPSSLPDRAADEISLLRNVFAAESAAALPAPLEIEVRGAGGSSSAHATTYFAGGTEWSATGLEGASLARGGAGERDVGFSVGRARSRLLEMSGWGWGWSRAGAATE